MSALAWGLVAMPLVAGALLAVGGHRVDRIAPAVGVAASGAALALACAAAVLRPSGSAPLFAGIAAAVRIDGLSAVLVVAVTAVTAAVLAFSAGPFDHVSARGRFVGLMLLFAGAMLVTVTAATLPLLLMGWEVMGATSWALIGFWWHEPARVRAANVAFLTTRAADLGLYLASGAALAGGVGSLRLDLLGHARTPWRDVVTVGVVLAALGKSAQLPFSFWLSRAMAGPSAVSALLHSATLVAAGGYLLVRLHPLLAASGWGVLVVGYAGASTALVVGLVAVAQSDLKQLLAASTCAQIGFVVLAGGVGATAGGAAQLVAHAVTKSLLFLVAGVWVTAWGSQRLGGLRGAARGGRLVGGAFVAGLVTLAGLPPLSLWVAKDGILAIAAEQNRGLYAVGLAAGAVSTVYSVRVAWYVLRAPPDAPAHCAGAPRVAVVTGVPLVTLAAAAVGLSALALPHLAPAWQATVGAAGEPPPGTGDLVLSAVVALAAATVTWRWAGAWPVAPVGVTRWLARWLDLETAARALVVRPTLALAHALAHLDDQGVHGAVRRVATAGTQLAGAVAWLDDHVLACLVAAVPAGARRLGWLARRPQTGRLHQYYAQIVIGVAALVVLVVLVG